jgi:hypothetical protein
MGLRPAKIHENESESWTMDGRSGEVGQTVGKSRLFNCLIPSVRIERINGRCLSRRKGESLLEEAFNFGPRSVRYP